MAQSALLNVMVGAARKAARTLKRDFGEVEQLQVSLKGPANFVTAADRKAEETLRTGLRSCGVSWEELPGEGAFYEPKIEYHLKDSLGRPWQVGTMQVDFSMPGRLGAEYVADDNTRKVPVMLHRAIVGSLERFVGILIENHAGAMPLWLAPVQVAVLNISDAQADYAQNVAQNLKKQGFRAIVD